MATKQFGLRTILTVTTGRLLTESEGPRDNGIGRLYGILNWMTSDELFTHQLGRASQECSPWLLRWFPELEACGSGSSLDRLDVLLATVGGDEAISQWVGEFSSVKPVYDIPKIPRDDHEYKNPLTELEDIVGKDNVIVLPIPSEED